MSAVVLADVQPTDGLTLVVADIELARSLRYADLDRARQAAQHGLQRLQQLQTPEARHESTEAELRMLLGSFDRQTGHVESAVVQFHETLKLQVGRPASRLSCDAWIGLGLAYTTSGDLARAMRYSLLGLKTARELGLQDREAHALDVLGCVYAIFGDAAQALLHLDAAAVIASESGNRKRLCSVLNNLAMTKLGCDEHAAALRAGQDALQIAREDDLVVMELNVVDTVASILLATGDRPQAEGLLVPAVSQARQHAPTKVLAELLTNLGSVRAASGDPAQAETLYAEALGVATAIGAPALVQRCHKRLADLFAGLNRWQDAHREFRQYHEVHESIAGARAATRLTVVRIADELDALQGDTASSTPQDSGLSQLGALEVLLARLQARNRELAEAKRAADAASEAKSRFLSTMSHELKTPLNGVLGMAQVLARTSLTDSQQRYCRQILASGKELNDLITDILEFSRVDAGRLEMETVEFEPGHLVAEVLDALRPAAAARGLKIEDRPDAGLPTALQGDARRIRQVLHHLVDNALKFTAQGTVEVGVTQLGPHPGDSRPWIRFAVRDTGCGIDSATLATLFKPFAQADDSSARRHGGSGLGLAICQRLVDSMGGRLACTSEPGTGSTFWFDIPLSLRPGVGANGD
jgi:signal transduction histidine kinase